MSIAGKTERDPFSYAELVKFSDKLYVNCFSHSAASQDWLGKPSDKIEFIVRNASLYVHV